MRFIQRVAVILVVSGEMGLIPCSATAQDLRGFVSLDTIAYLKDGDGDDHINRLSAEFETHRSLTASLDFDMRLYGSVNLEDSAGSYFDPTIAKLAYTRDRLRIDLGNDIAYWGVTESQQVVDVINQRDQIRDLEGKLPLGQPMLAFTYFGDTTTLSTYVLPRFVELNYGSDDLRLGLPLPVDDDNPVFESSDGRNHIDYAARLWGYFGNLESAISVFDGTLREPVLRLDSTQQTLRPYYRQGVQYGLELQYTRDAALFKLEGRHVKPDSGDSFQNLVYGIEYVLGSVFQTRYELSLFAEHNWDSRGKDSPSVFQNDLFVGARLDFANTLATRLRVGGYFDLDYGSLFTTARLETRLNDRISLQVAWYMAEADDPADRLYTAQDIDQISIGLKWNF